MNSGARGAAVSNCRSKGFLVVADHKILIDERDRDPANDRVHLLYVRFVPAAEEPGGAWAPVLPSHPAGKISLCV